MTTTGRRFDGQPLAPVNTPHGPTEAAVETPDAGGGIIWLMVTTPGKAPTPVCLLVREAVDLAASLTAAIEIARA